MNASKVVIANWRTDYSQPFAIIVAIGIGVASTWIVAKRKRVR